MNSTDEQTTNNIVRRTHDAFALATKKGRAEEARMLIAALREEVGDEHEWMKIKASALHRGAFS